MFDHLHQAVQAEVAAHTPAVAPSFDALKHRKHRRDRRRTIAAITASALAAAGIAFVPSALGSGGTAPAQIAQDPAPAPVRAEDGRLPCDSPRMFIYGLASTTGGAATPEQAAEEFGARPNAEPGYAGQTWTRGETKANGELQLYGQTARLGTVEGSDGTWFVIAGSACPVGVAAAEQYGFHVKATDARAVLAAGKESQDAIKRCMDLPGIYNAVVQFNSPGQWTGFITGRDQAEGFKRCVEAVPDWEASVKAAQLAPSVDSPDGGIAWRGVTVCRLAGQGENDCQTFGAEEAEALDDAVLTATPAPEGQAYCEALTPAYAVKFEHPSVRPVPITVRVGCGPMDKGGQDFLLPVPAQKLVQRTHADAAADPSATAFIRRCVAPTGELPAPDPGYVGKTEGEVQNDATDGAPFRVIGRDGRCLDRTSDYQPERVDLIVVRDKIIWAGRP